VNRPAQPDRSLRARLVSLDAYRGFVMLAMLSSQFGFPEIAQRFPGNPVWAFLASQFNHVPWQGCAFWDLIQPSFMFIVGVAIPFSYASRLEKGQSHRQIYTHAFARAAILIALGLVGVLMMRRLVLFKSPWPVPIQTAHILVQIGITYGLAFPLVRRRPSTQLAVAAAILVVDYVAFLLYPAPGPGLFAHWTRNANLGTAWDQWLLLNTSEYLQELRSVGLTSLNFVPGISTVIAGMLAGGLLHGSRSHGAKTRWLGIAGAACFIGGLVMGRTLCPIVKAIWTPSFVLYSTAWALWLLAAFYWVIDVRGWRRWALPLVVVGLNPITLFVLYSTIDWWIWRAWVLVLGRGVFESTYGPLWSALAVFVVLWALAGVLYRRRIFIRL
jgi:heparan-alpha-glucosaminide N-acetyltransferase